jgi:hypothetical protein
MEMNSGTGMVLGAGIGIVFDAMLGTRGFGLIAGAGIGLVLEGAASPPDNGDSIQTTKQSLHCGSGFDGVY